MILTVTANPAYDLTYRMAKFEYGAVQRVPEVEQRVGGKGLNVARVLRSLGVECMATGFADLAFATAAGRELPVDFVTCLPWVRRTVVITEANGTTTGLWEPGAPLPDPSSVHQLRAKITELLPRAHGLVISGSLPKGVGPSLPAQLAGLATAAGIPVICDVDGEALRHASRVPGVVLMPNADELHSLTGATPSTPAEVATAAGPLLSGGVAAIIATRGPDGMVAITPHGSWSAHLPTPIQGNPTGAGDAAAASAITTLRAHQRRMYSRERHAGSRQHEYLLAREWGGLLVGAVAVSGAAVGMPLAGEIDLGVRDRLVGAVVVESVRVPDVREFS
ncbi:hexose kinase [Nocardia crassostreae]|uniref:hexose kinase n=1 Tax=Nocardia crassostreae TaxID=53428 RepID=UPI000830BFE6|nr:hexose kinase [Nocardia crassostreae]